jgi:transcriptional regulator with PAS, ATPase and Fis domain
VLREEHLSEAQQLVEPFSVAFENDHRLQELARMREALEADRRALLSRLERQDITDTVVGEAAGLRSVMERVEQVAPTDAPVLILGETGSGKEVIARSIHARSRRAAGPVVRVNCGAIPPQLIDSELFGHERGSFTGAVGTRKGWFERADGGTLFLDEIAELPLEAQVRLLRVLQDGSLERVGGHQAITVDVRIVAATHRDLSSMVDAGTFRRDLYYRLNVIRIDVPALRARPGDVELLVRHFVAKHAAGRAVRVSRATLDLLSAYSWPGNVRQLENELRRALVLADGVIQPEHLSDAVREGGKAEAEKSDGLNVKKRVDALEAELVRAALERTGGNQTRAAELLGLSRFGLQKMIRRLKIEGPYTALPPA